MLDRQCATIIDWNYNAVRPVKSPVDLEKRRVLDSAYIPGTSGTSTNPPIHAAKEYYDINGGFLFVARFV